MGRILASFTFQTQQRCALHSCGAVAEFHRASRTFLAVQKRSRNAQYINVANHKRIFQSDHIAVEVKG